MTSTAITNKKTMPKAIVLGFGFNSLTAGQYGDSFNKAVTCWCSSQLTNLQRKICVVLSQCAKFSLGNRLQNICFFLKKKTAHREGGGLWVLHLAPRELLSQVRALSPRSPAFPLVF